MVHPDNGIVFSIQTMEYFPASKINKLSSHEKTCRNFKYILLNYCFFVQLLSCVQLFVTPWTAACQDSLSFTISQSLLKLMSIESMMPSNHLTLGRPLLLLPLIFPNIRVLSNESVLCIRWPKFNYRHCQKGNILR